MTDTGKHSALRQTSDGSFEIVFESGGLQEVSEDRSATTESARPDVAVAAPAGPSRRVVLFTVGGIAIILVLAVIGWIALGPSKSREPEVEDVPGFRPYGGTPEVSQAQGRPAPRVALPPEEDEEAMAEPTVPAEEITESEPGWELTEPEVPAEGDGAVEIPAVPLAQEPPVEAEVPAEEEVVEEAPVEEPPADEVPADGEVTDEQGALDDVGDARIRAFANRRGVDALRVREIGRGVKLPMAPSFNTSPIGSSRFQALPVRTIDTQESDGEAAEDEIEIIEEY